MKSDKEFRAKMILRFGEILGENQPTSPEEQVATVEALCGLAATVRLASRGLCFGPGETIAAAVAAIEGMDRWVADHGRRN